MAQAPDGLPGDAGGVVNNVLVKTALALTVIGVAAFDALSVGATTLAVEDQADAAARAAVEAWQGGHDPRVALRTAEAAAAEADPANVVDPASFTVTADGSVALDLHRTARTFVAGRIGRLAGWVSVEAHGTAGPA